MAIYNLYVIRYISSKSTEKLLLPGLFYRAFSFRLPPLAELISASFCMLNAQYNLREVICRNGQMVSFFLLDYMGTEKT